MSCTRARAERRENAQERVARDRVRRRRVIGLRPCHCCHEAFRVRASKPQQVFCSVTCAVRWRMRYTDMADRIAASRRHRRHLRAMKQLAPVLARLKVMRLPRDVREELIRLIAEHGHQEYRSGYRAGAHQRPNTRVALAGEAA